MPEPTTSKQDTTFTTYQSIRSRQFSISLHVEFLVRCAGRATLWGGGGRGAGAVCGLAE